MRVAQRKGATPAQIALAWLLAQRPWIVPIPGTRRADHLEENLGAIDVELTPADLREMEAELSKIAVHGGRMCASTWSKWGRVVHLCATPQCVRPILPGRVSVHQDSVTAGRPTWPFGPFRCRRPCQEAVTALAVAPHRYPLLRNER